MKLLAVDSNSILNRAFYGIKLLSTKDGTYTNAIVGFFNIINKLLEDIRPDAVAFAFDLKGPTFRHQLYEGYKAQRKGMPPELAMQLPLVKELLGHLGYAIVEKEGFEADDILGTLATACCGNQGCVIATGDRDALQLVGDCVTVLLATTKAGGALYTPMDVAAVQEKYGVTPAQLIDVKALMGDASDNIPGVAGIGEKTALNLISRFGSLDAIYENLETLDVTAGVRAKLEAGREMAYTSQTLARIDCKVPVETDAALYTRKPGDPAAAYRLLAKLEMFKIAQKLGLSAADAPAPPQQEEEQPRPALRVEMNPGPEALAALAGQPVLDIALAGGPEAPAAAAIRAGEVIYCADGGEAAQTMLHAVLALPNPKRAENAKELFRVGYNTNLDIQNVIFDIRLAGYLLNPNSPQYSVERLCGEYEVTPCPAQPPGGCGEAAAELIACCAGLSPLADRLEALIAEKGQAELLGEIELPLARVLASMEGEGFAIDREGLEEFGRELEVELQRLEGEIYQLAGTEFNINSPKQLGEVLFDRLELPVRKKTKSGYSTDAEVLESLISYHPMVGKILDYRKYAKLKSTYVEGLGKQVAADGRIHSVFNQTETRTGRISSTEPNLQNIPVRTELGARLRRFFHAREGWVLVDADYSQIELRVLAAIADDQNMIAAFQSGEDIHTNTAAQVFDLPPLFVTPLMRSRAKAVNFGIVYGIGAFSLSKDIGVTVAEADQYIKNYLKTYSGVKAYMERTVADGKERGYVSTVFGRRRYLPELHNSNHNIRAFGERVAMNAPIQGTAADIIKIAMVRVYDRLRAEGLAARLILQVHDELIVEAPEAEAQQVAKLLKEEMEAAAQLKVPMVADVGIGVNWQEAH